MTDMNTKKLLKRVQYFILIPHDPSNEYLVFFPCTMQKNQTSDKLIVGMVEYYQRLSKTLLKPIINKP